MKYLTKIRVKCIKNCYKNKDIFNSKLILEENLEQIFFKDEIYYYISAPIFDSDSHYHIYRDVDDKYLDMISRFEYERAFLPLDQIRDNLLNIIVDEH